MDKAKSLTLGEIETLAGVSNGTITVGNQEHLFRVAYLISTGYLDYNSKRLTLRLTDKGEKALAAMKAKEGHDAKE